MMMKRIVSLIIICIIITATAQIGVSAASANFTVEDGVLLSYSGDAANITIPTEVYRIESGVFEDNTSIKSVTIPSSVTEIGDKAFYNCSSLSEVAGGENVYSVGAFCFDKTPYLTQSHDEFFTLGKALLWYNGTASQVTLPDGIWSIAPYAFLRCQTIRSFSASDDLSMIGEGAFFECTHLSLVSIPNSVKFIDAYAFTGTSYQAQAGEFVVLGDGILTAYNGGDDEIMIPDSVRLIAPRTFYEYTALSKVKIPSSVYAIGKQAFCQCTSLSDLSLSSGLVHIGEEAFVNCKKLKTLSLPSSVSLVDKGAFLNCTGLEELSLCGKELSVSYGAFAYCIHQIPDPLDFTGHIVHIFLGADACGLCLLLNLLTVLIGAGLEVDIKASLPLVAGDGICQHDLIGIADMGFCRGIGNGRRNIIGFLLAHKNSPLKKKNRP